MNGSIKTGINAFQPIKLLYFHLVHRCTSEVLIVEFHTWYLHVPLIKSFQEHHIITVNISNAICMVK